jgi:Tol biopolymer transport system component
MLGRVRRFVPIAALLAGLVLALPSSAQVGSGKIAFGTRAGVFTVNPDGSGAALFRANATALNWSPDGSSAFYLTGVWPVPASLMVANADGSGEHEVVSGCIFVSGCIDWPYVFPPLRSWSPDGSRISYTRSLYGGGADVYTASAAGGDERRLTFDGLEKGWPVWSPTGLLLAYSAYLQQSGSSELFVVGADGTGPTQITHSGGRNGRPVWSPDGSLIAFDRTPDPYGSSHNTIFVIRPDGSDLHQVADTEGPGEPAWSPDGTRIAFSTSATSARSRWGSGSEIYAVNADGSGMTRLTELGPHFVADSWPTWSPDGDRLLFERGGPRSGLYTMNADGSCEEFLTANEWFASWQPVPGGVPIGEKRCHALSVETKLTDIAVGTSIDASVKNEGTEPLTTVTLTTAAGNDLSLTDVSVPIEGGECSTANAWVTCRIPRLERGQPITVSMIGRPRRVGLDRRSRDISITADIVVSASEQLLPTWRESGTIRFQSARCSVRDLGAGLIDGTRFRDRICGRRGADRIYPGKGKDIVAAGAGDDVIFARDPNVDRISCGPGWDRVIADPKDRVARDCERVNRY